MTPDDMIAALGRHHPHIAERIARMWNDPLCASYMTDLMIPSRYGRQGFSETASRALMNLIELHDKQHPPKSDVWDMR